MTTIEKNELIADFMEVDAYRSKGKAMCHALQREFGEDEGRVFIEDKELAIYLRKSEDEDITVSDDFLVARAYQQGWVDEIAYMPYHKSWDLLMPVITKVHNDISYLLDGTEENFIGDLSIAIIDTDIIRAWATVAESIRWYMKHKYPFKEGDDYWTIERGGVVWSCWDEQSEDMHTADSTYYSTSKEAIEAFNSLSTNK
jgi:hypothetical protein